MSIVDGSARLEVAVRRRDRVFEALAVTLFIAIIAPLMWMILLVCFWGVLDAPWLSVPFGLVGTGLLIWWGAGLGRGSVNRARGARPAVALSGGQLRVHGLPMEFTMPLSAVRVVAVDQPARRQRRADRVRFPVGTAASGPVGWLSCPDESALPGLDFGFPRAPNLAVIAAAPVRLGPDGRSTRGFVATVVDAEAARRAFATRGVPVRPLEAGDVVGIRAAADLPVRRLGPGGLREVRSEDRTRARVFDGFAILVLFFIFAAVLAPPGRNQIPGVVAAMLLAWFLYEVPSTAVAGQTLGKVVVGLRVVRIEDGRARLGLGRATGRWLLRMVNGFVGAPAGRLASGDALGAAMPSLSLINGVGAGTLVVADGEYRRLRGLASAEQRQLELDRTVRDIEKLEPTVSPRAAWISLLIVLVLAGAVLIPILVGVGAAPSR